ncbi:hypothetical protein R5W24_001945 [Gemmata sp. JC717]|uniref:hypothetical protein n=1 Tax=Gemmata algarum TaxID=2975278 RepID=UPI0021BA7ABB|nr:hypothetical protein [Gemmata algarum]MDY3552856.1 hypothetical protein [Gemmata algarum]
MSNELLDAIGRETSDATPVRFDLFVRDPARGVEMLQHAARASGVTVHADAATLDRLKKRQVHSVVVYAECLTAKELAALFAKIAVEDAKYSPRVGDSLHAAAVVRSDELELKTVLGLDVGLYKRPAGNSSHGVGGSDRVVTPGKAVSANTLDQVVQSVSGGSTPPAPKAQERPMVLLTWQTTHPGIARTNPLQSTELKQYLQKRGTRKPAAVPALIIIRPAG